MNKVALIYYHPLSSIDGATKVIKSFVDNDERLKKNGIELDVFAPTQNSGVVCDHKSVLGTIKEFVKKAIFKLDFAGVLRMMYNLYVRSDHAVKNYMERINGKEYNSVFVHDLLTCYCYLKHGDNKPVMLVMHTTGDFFSMTLTYFPLLKYTLFYNVVLKNVLNTVLNKVDGIVFNSKIAADNFYKIYPNARSGIASFVNNGVVDLTEDELSNECHSNPPFHVVCVGSISERKGQRFIVEALRTCSEKARNNVRFHFVGDGEIRTELEDICTRYNLNEYVEFCGLQTNIVPFLKRSDIFILPSTDEGMPISILEAMRQGLPVVSTKVGGIPYQVIDNVTGLLIEPSTAGVRHFIEHIEEFDWKKMGKESRNRYVEEFGITQMMDKYSSLLNKIC